MGVPTKLLDNPDFINDLKSSLKQADVARKWNVDKNTVKKWRSRLNDLGGYSTQKKVSTLKKGEESYREQWTGNQGEMSVVISGEEISKDAILRKFGHDSAKVQIVGTLEETHWMSGGDTWNHRYRFKTERRTDDDVELVDGLQILGELRAKSYRPSFQPCQGESAFCLSINDTQFGKSEGKNNGTPETLARIDKAVESAELRIAELNRTGRNLGTLVVVGGGDIVEGCVIYPNQSYNLDMDRRSQINTAVGTILNILDRLAPLFKNVKVIAARGNHGENRIGGNRTTLYDNDDTLVFEMAKLATDRDEALKHIQYTIADDEAGVYTDVCGWRLATTHGDVYGKGVAGATIDKKAQNWYKNMAMKRDPLGSADVLVTHHWHHNKMSDWGSCLWRQTPAMDGGSKWFEQSSGEYSAPGMLSWVMTPEKRWQDEQIL